MFHRRTITKDTVSQDYKDKLLVHYREVPSSLSSFVSRLSSKKREESKREKTVLSVAWKWRDATKIGTEGLFQYIRAKLSTRRDL